MARTPARALPQTPDDDQPASGPVVLPRRALPTERDAARSPRNALTRLRRRH